MIEIRSYTEAKTRHFEEGWRDHQPDARRRSTLHLARTTDQHGHSVLKCRRLADHQSRLAFFALFTPVDKVSIERNAGLQQQMAQNVANPMEALSRSWQNKHSHSPGKELSREKVTPEASSSKSSEESLQVEYLSPEHQHRSYSNSSVGLHTQSKANPEEHFDPPMNFRKKSIAESAWKEQKEGRSSPTSGQGAPPSKEAPDSKRRAPLHRRSKHLLINEQSSSSLLAPSPSKSLSSGSPLKALQKQGDLFSRSSIAPSISSTLHEPASGHHREEPQAMHDYALNQRSTAPATGASVTNRRLLVPPLDFTKIEEIRMQDLASEETSEGEVTGQGPQQETGGQVKESLL